MKNDKKKKTMFKKMFISQGIKSALYVANFPLSRGPDFLMSIKDLVVP